MQRFRFGTLLLFVSLLVATASGSLRAETISLTVDATKTSEKLLRVQEVISVKPGALTLYYPKWIPGRHGPDGPIANVTGLHFESGGKALPWVRDALDIFAFHLDVPVGVSRLDASFDFIQREGDSVTDKLMVLEWNEAVLYPGGILATRQTVNAKIILPASWKYGTSLPVEHVTGNEITFKPAYLDFLVDSPIIAGQYYRTIDITPPGESIPHELDVAADSEIALNISDENKNEMTNLVAESGKLFGTRHYRDYHFLLALSDHLHPSGLEHHESSASRLPERLLLSPGAGMDLGGLLAHEFVHSWNGKYRRPADLTVPYYEQPMETDLLWSYEGLTDYLGSLLATRSGLWTPEQYHESLAAIAAALGPGRPGRTWRPLLDTAIAEPSPGNIRGWYRWRRDGDYYDEGDLLWLEIATMIDRDSKGQKTVDDFCLSFYGGANNGPEVKTYTFDSLVASLNKVSPFDWTTFLHTRLDSTAPEAPIGGIENGGWKVVYDAEPSKLTGPHGGPTDIYSIGLQLGPDGSVNDSNVDGSAFNAGIKSGMKVIGVNGRLYTHELLEDAVEASAKTPMMPITLIVVNDDYISTVNIDYHGGSRYPHLIRDEQKPDYLDELIKPLAVGS